MRWFPTLGPAGLVLDMLDRQREDDDRRRREEDDRRRRREEEELRRRIRSEQLEEEEDRRAALMTEAAEIEAHIQEMRTGVRMVGHCHEDDGWSWYCCPGCKDNFKPDGMPKYLLNTGHEPGKCPGAREK